MNNLESCKEKILVVDDESSIRRILETRLSMIGYDVATASDGEETLLTFHACDPDLIVLDVMMPKLDGYGVCQELRKEGEQKLYYSVEAALRTGLEWLRDE